MFLGTSIKQDDKVSNVAIGAFDGLRDLMQKMSQNNSHRSSQQIAFAMWAKWVERLFQLCQDDPLRIAAKAYNSVSEATLEAAVWAPGLASTVMEVLDAFRNVTMMGETATSLVKASNLVSQPL